MEFSINEIYEYFKTFYFSQSMTFSMKFALCYDGYYVIFPNMK